MIRSMTKRAVRQFVRRWKAVNDFERQELRRTPPAEKLRQLQALLHSAIAFGWDDDNQEATQAIRKRWKRQFAKVLEAPEILSDLNAILRREAAPKRRRGRREGM